MPLEKEPNQPHTKYDNDFENIVDISPVPIMIHKMGLVLYANSLCKDLFDLDDVSELVGKNLIEFVHPEDRAAVIDAIKQGVTEKRSNAVLSNRMITKTGRILNIETKSSSINFKGEDCRLAVAYDYHLLTKVEEELKNKNLLIEKIAQIIPDSLIVVESKSRKVLFENKPLLNLLGYTDADMGGKDQFDFITGLIHKEDIPKLLESRKFIFDPANNGKYASTEYRIKDKSGKWRWILARSTIFKTVEGEAHQINFGISQDITALKEIEQELLNSKSFIEKINNTLPLHVSIFDLQSMGFVYRNYDIGTTLGYAENEVADIMQLAHPDYAADALKNLQGFALMKEGEKRAVVGKYLTKEGEVKHLLTRATPFLMNPDGTVRQILTTTSDLTDLKEAELKLQFSEETRKAILSALPDIVFQIDTTGLIRDMYAGEEFRHAMAGKVIAGKYVTDFLPEKQAAVNMKLVAEVVATGRMQTHEYVHQRDGQEMHYELRISKLNEECAIMVMRDVSQLRLTREQLDQKLGELWSKNQVLEKYITSNAELEKFAYIASHDLREPIRSIVGFTQLLQKRFDKEMNDEAKEFLDNIINSAQRMNTLVLGLLDYSRVSSNGKAFSSTNLNDVLQKVLDDLSVMIEETGAEISIDKLPVINCDELQIRQLFQNLVSNSIKFRKPNEVPAIKISVQLKDGKQVFSVSDNGIGLDMKYSENVFHIFSRLHTSDKYPGSGIGLAVCKKIVERHNGKIWLESETGKGTAFYFTLG